MKPAARQIENYDELVESVAEAPVFLLCLSFYRVVSIILKKKHARSVLLQIFLFKSRLTELVFEINTGDNTFNIRCRSIFHVVKKKIIINK